MAQKVIIERNKAGLEDCLFGTGTVTQSRNGKDVTVTKINAKNLPFDDSRSLAKAITDLGEYNQYLQQYGKAIENLQNNIQVIIDIQAQSDAAISPLTSANSLKLEGSNLSQVRANINASLLNGFTLNEIKDDFEKNIDAKTLQGKALTEIYDDANTARVNLKTQIDNEQDTKSAMLGIAIWSNSIRANKLQFSGVIV